MTPPSAAALDSVFADEVRVVNKKETPDFLTRYGVSRKKIRFCPSFYLDFTVFHPEPNVKKEYDLVYCARLERNKGIMNLIQALKIIKIQKPDIKLLLIGKGSLLPFLQAYVRQNNLENNIIFSGWLADARAVADAYRSARFFVNPSLNEGGPRVLLEAMACGLPVITTRVGIAHDVIQEGENGWFSGWSPRELADGILNALSGNINIKPLYREDFSYANAIRAYAELLMHITK